MGKYLIKDAEGRLWARVMTRKRAVKMVDELAQRMTNKKFHIVEEN